MEDIPAPFTVITDFPFPPSRVEQIRTARLHQSSAGPLLFDRLLSLAQVSVSLYPPTDVLGLRQLITHINASTSFDSLRRSCLILYLLFFYLDDRADQYASQHAIPHNFVHSTRAYWLVDNRSFSDGVNALALASLGGPLDFLPAIIKALPPSQCVRLYRLIKPAITDLESILSLITALVSVNRVPEAWAFGQKLARKNATIVWNTIIDKCFELAKLDNPTSQDPIRSLLCIPLSSTLEEDVIKQACSCIGKSPSPETDSRVDFLTARYIASGSHPQALHLLSDPSTPSPSCPQAHVRRHTAIKSLRSILTHVEMQQYELEADSLQKSPENDVDDSMDATIIQHPQDEKVTSPAKENQPFSASPFFRKAAPLNSAKDASQSQTKTLLGALVRASGKHPTMGTKKNAVSRSKATADSPFAPSSPFRNFQADTRENNTGKRREVSSSQTPIRVSTPPLPMDLSTRHLQDDISFGEDNSRFTSGPSSVPPSLTASSINATMSARKPRRPRDANSGFGTAKKNSRALPQDVDNKLPGEFPGDIVMGDTTTQDNNSKRSQEKLSQSRTRSSQRPVSDIQHFTEEEEEEDHVSPLSSSPVVNKSKKSIPATPVRRSARLSTVDKSRRM